MNRKKFFALISTVAIAYSIRNSFPMKFISGKKNNLDQNIKIFTNPLSVSRTKQGKQNV